jgi:hypothetical protein
VKSFVLIITVIYLLYLYDKSFFGAVLKTLNDESKDTNELCKTPHNNNSFKNKMKKFRNIVNNYNEKIEDLASIKKEQTILKYISKAKRQGTFEKNPKQVPDHSNVKINNLIKNLIRNSFYNSVSQSNNLSQTGAINFEDSLANLNQQRKKKEIEEIIITNGLVVSQ